MSVEAPITQVSVLNWDETLFPIRKIFPRIQNVFDFNQVLSVNCCVTYRITGAANFASKSYVSEVVKTADSLMKNVSSLNEF